MARKVTVTSSGGSGGITVEDHDASPTSTTTIDFNTGLAVNFVDGEASVNVDLGDITDWTNHIDGVGDPHTEYVKENDANYVDLTDGGATVLHSHAGGTQTNKFAFFMGGI